MTIRDEYQALCMLPRTEETCVSNLPITTSVMTAQVDKLHMNRSILTALHQVLGNLVFVPG